MRLHEDLSAVDALLGRRFPLTGFDEELKVKIGPVAMRAKMPGGYLEHLMPRYAGFVISGNGPIDFEAEAYIEETLDLRDYPNIMVKSLPGGRVHYVFRWDFVARIDTGKRRAEILIAPAGSPLCIDSILRISTSFAAVESGGFLLHSAAIASEDRAFAFCGVSGCGKSTVSKLSVDTHDVMTDEMALIEKTSSGYVVWGTPYWGEMQMSVNRSAPLKAVFLLTKAESNSIETVPASTAITEFMKTVLHFGQNMEVLGSVMDEAIKFAGKVPIERLNFLPDNTFWEVINDKYGK